MKVYLVRHGSTNEAEGNKRQFPDSPLSELGIKQAQAAAKRLLNEDIDLILSSDWPRAKQTAEIISSEIGKPMEVFWGIHEKESNPILHGVEYGSDIQKEHDEELKKHHPNMDWKFKDQGESMRDILKRAAKFRDHLLKDLGDKKVVVVSHSAFIRSFLGACIFGDQYNDLDILKFLLSMHVTNAGISKLVYDEKREIWQIVYLNDHLHINF